MSRFRVLFAVSPFLVGGAILVFHFLTDYTSYNLSLLFALSPIFCVFVAGIIERLSHE